MESESNLHDKNTEQLINETTEYYKNEDFDESKNPLCTGIKNIIGMFPAPPPPRPLFDNLNTRYQSLREDQQSFYTNVRKKNRSFENACRHKDPYLDEVNRLMFCSTMGHPPNGSQEHFQAAENYALYGKEFLDFPTDIKFPKRMDVSCLDGDVSAQLSNSFPKSNDSHQGLGLQKGKYTNLGNTSFPQLPVMMNTANYWGYPFYQTPNLVQPLMYSNPFLMTQYLNMFVRETQINTSIVQHHQFLSGGIHERLVCAQTLQQQIQTNQAAQGSFSGSMGAGVGKSKIKLQDAKKGELNLTCDGSDLRKTSLNGIALCDNILDLDD